MAGCILMTMHGQTDAASLVKDSVETATALHKKAENDTFHSTHPAAAAAAERPVAAAPRAGVRCP